MADAANAPEKKDMLLSLGAHEIRNPAAVILGYVRMLSTERLGPLSDSQRKALEEIEKSTTKLAGLAKEMSLLARLMEGGAPFVWGRVELAALIAGEIAGLGPSLVGDVRIRVIDNAPSTTVKGDATRLGDAFNALMFSHRREVFTTHELCVAIDRIAGGDPLPIRIAIGGADRIEELRLLPVSKLEPLVEFRGGVGYRLSIAREVIEHHGGRVFSKTEPGASLHAPSIIVGAVILLPES